jgi:hypothetical protein
MGPVGTMPDRREWVAAHAHRKKLLNSDQVLPGSDPYV